MFFWAIMLVIAAILWSVELYLRKKDAREQARLRALAQAHAAKRKAALAHKPTRPKS